MERVRCATGNLLIVIGEIDLATVSILDADLSALPPTGDVLLDLSEVSFLGVVGLRLLWSRSLEARARHQSFAIRALRPQHRRLLERLDLLTELVTLDARRPYYEALPHAN